jgi:Mat/Ecp fimbriae outer membrane usher protein
MQTPKARTLNGRLSALTSLFLAFMPLCSICEDSHTQVLAADSDSPSLQQFLGDFGIRQSLVSPPSEVAEQPDTLYVSERQPALSNFLTDFGIRREVVVQAPAPKAASTGVPAGFEALMMEQTTLVDVYFANRFLVSTLATFTPGSVTFDTPEEVVELIPTLVDKSSVLIAMSNELASNSEMRCYSKGQADCGSLLPEVAEVIFNSDNYRADLFINPALLSVQQNVVQKYLGPSSSGMSFFQTVNYAVASGVETLRSFNGRTIFSIRETSLEVLSDHSSGSGFNITSMNLQRDWQGRRYQGGYISTNSNNLRFSRNSNIIGFRVGTTLDTREDLRQATGNTIEIFLPQRSRVSLFKDERLIASTFYEPGNQQLDTSSLPGGAYDVEIVITDSTGERRETRFYSKSGRIPPADQPQYFVEAGSIVNRGDSTLPETSDDSLWRMGYNRRLTGFSSMILGISGSDDNTMLEAGWFGLFRSVESGIDLALTEDNSLGVNLSLRLPFFGSHVFIDHRQVWQEDAAVTAENHLLGSELTQSSLSTSIPLGSRTLNVGARYNSRGSLGSERTYSATYHLKDLRFGKASLRSKIQWVRQDDKDTVLFNVGLYTSGDRVSFNVDSEYNYIDDVTGTDSVARGSTSLSYRNATSNPTSLFTQVNTRHQTDVESLGVEFDARGRFGRFRTQAERNFADDDSKTVFNGNYAASLVATPGSFAFGGQELNRSAIIIDLSKSQAESNHFDVLVDNTPVGTALPGRRTVVPVTPYAQYDVNLRARGAGVYLVRGQNPQCHCVSGQCGQSQLGSG